jgi:CHAD domain-containing protein
MPRKLFRRWRKRLRQLVKALPKALARCRLKGLPEQLHQLRVIIRRLRLVLKLGRSFWSRKAVKAFDAWARPVNERAGAVRDLDITVERLRALNCSADVTLSLSKARTNRWRRLRTLLKAPHANLIKPFGLPEPTDAAVRKFRRRFQRRTERERARALEMGRRFARMTIPQRHEFRRLVHVQDLAGEYQNLVTTLDNLQTQRQQPARGLIGALISEIRRSSRAAAASALTL